MIRNTFMNRFYHAPFTRTEQLSGPFWGKEKRTRPWLQVHTLNSIPLFLWTFLGTLLGDFLWNFFGGYFWDILGTFLRLFCGKEKPTSTWLHVTTHSPPPFFELFWEIVLKSFFRIFLKSSRNKFGDCFRTLLEAFWELFWALLEKFLGIFLGYRVMDQALASGILLRSLSSPLFVFLHFCLYPHHHHHHNHDLSGADHWFQAAVSRDQPRVSGGIISFRIKMIRTARW